jgi:protein-disulfide isomerase
LIRLSARIFSAAALSVLSVYAIQAAAQQQVPPAPAAQQPQSTPAMQAPAPAAPTPNGPPVFPKPDPANFSATTPTKDEIEGFLSANWGFDPSLMWQTQAVLKTPVDGVSKVIVLFGDKTGKEKPQVLSFFTLPDGKHIIVGDSIVDFGVHPFAAVRAKMQERADGPYRGAASKDLELVEFADFQCPHCKEAQANMDKLAADYPKARIVFQNFPIVQIHPQAGLAAAYGLCVSKQGSSTAFFQFASAVFDGQDGLSTPDGATLTLNSAVAKAGLDPAKVSACATTPETKAAVDASVKLAGDLGVSQVPMLFINGRPVQANAQYDTLKKMVDYQIKADGITQ